VTGAAGRRRSTMAIVQGRAYSANKVPPREAAPAGADGQGAGKQDSDKAREKLLASLTRRESAETGYEEVEAACDAVLRLTPDFANKARIDLFCELLKRLAREKEQRRARNLNHWSAYAKERIPGIAGEMLAERSERVAVHLRAAEERWRELAWRVTRNADLADQAVQQTAWELWQGRTGENVSNRALLMNARNLLRDNTRASHRTASLDGLVSTARLQGRHIDFPSHRAEDQDPLDILIAREGPSELDDELTYAVDNVHCQGNKGVRRFDWWKESGLSELEREVRRTKNGGSGE
ncbi:MAG: hypothetical protein KGL53_06210, partial [Elusimicrobia bacterium]|nr:hypothetical protein [Elusimicrobiota bacterium]